MGLEDCEAVGDAGCRLWVSPAWVVEHFSSSNRRPRPGRPGGDAVSGPECRWAVPRDRVSLCSPGWPQIRCSSVPTEPRDHRCVPKWPCPLSVPGSLGSVLMVRVVPSSWRKPLAACTWAGKATTSEKALGSGGEPGGSPRLLHPQQPEHCTAWLHGLASLGPNTHPNQEGKCRLRGREREGCSKSGVGSQACAGVGCGRAPVLSGPLPRTQGRSVCHTGLVTLTWLRSICF